MVKVNVFKERNFPVSSVLIKKKLRAFFIQEGISSDCQVEVAIVGRKRGLDLAERYLKEKTPHNVLSFTREEKKSEFIFPPDGKIHLGEIVICFPVAFDEAKIESKLIEDKVCELIEHGANHLLGRHHS